MSGGHLSSSLWSLPEELAAELEKGDFSPLVRQRLELLIKETEKLHLLVKAADRLIGGDIGEETFNFEWNSALQQGDEEDQDA